MLLIYLNISYYVYALISTHSIFIYYCNLTYCLTMSVIAISGICYPRLSLTNNALQSFVFCDRKAVCLSVRHKRELRKIGVATVVVDGLFKSLFPLVSDKIRLVIMGDP